MRYRGEALNLVNADTGDFTDHVFRRVLDPRLPRSSLATAAGRLVFGIFAALAGVERGSGAGDVRLL